MLPATVWKERNVATLFAGQLDHQVSPMLQAPLPEIPLAWLPLELGLQQSICAHLVAALVCHEHPHKDMQVKLAQTQMHSAAQQLGQSIRHQAFIHPSAGPDIAHLLEEQCSGFLARARGRDALHVGIRGPDSNRPRGDQLQQILAVILKLRRRLQSQQMLAQHLEKARVHGTLVSTAHFANVRFRPLACVGVGGVAPGAVDLKCEHKPGPCNSIPARVPVCGQAFHDQGQVCDLSSMPLDGVGQQVVGIPVFPPGNSLPREAKVQAHQESLRAHVASIPSERHLVAPIQRHVGPLGVGPPALAQSGAPQVLRESRDLRFELLTLSLEMLCPAFPVGSRFAIPVLQRPHPPRARRRPLHPWLLVHLSLRLGRLSLAVSQLSLEGRQRCTRLRRPGRARHDVGQRAPPLGRT
eukprot:4804400-Alexandrium_andersonii.AAC.1